MFDHISRAPNIEFSLKCHVCKTWTVPGFTKTKIIFTTLKSNCSFWIPNFWRTVGASFLFTVTNSCRLSSIYDRWYVAAPVSFSARCSKTWWFMKWEQWIELVVKDSCGNLYCDMMWDVDFKLKWWGIGWIYGRGPFTKGFCVWWLYSSHVRAQIKPFKKASWD